MILPHPSLTSEHASRRADVTIVDLAGRNLGPALEAMHPCDRRTVLLAPEWSDPTSATALGLRPLPAWGSGAGTHVDMDRLVAMIHAGWSRSGMGAWDVCAPVGQEAAK